MASYFLLLIALLLNASASHFAVIRIFIRHSDVLSSFSEEFELSKALTDQLIFLIWVVTSAFILITIMGFYKDEVLWIRKELESLKALMDDLDKLEREERVVELRVRTCWPSEPNLVCRQPSEGEEEWMDSIRNVDSEANNCITTFGELTGLRSLVLALFTPSRILQCVFHIRMIKKEIINCLNEGEKNKYVRHIYESMERSRSKNRCLLGRYTIPDNNFEINDPLQEPSHSFKGKAEIITRTNGLFYAKEEEEIWLIYSLLPLHAFLQDLHQLQLETQTEYIWMKQAVNLIAEAEDCIDTLITRWHSTFGNNWLARDRFRRHMKRISTAFATLLNRKRQYGFDFSGRAAASESVRHFLLQQQQRSTYPYTDEQIIESAIKIIHDKLSDGLQSWERVEEIQLLLRRLENMYNSLDKREETAVKKACLCQLKRIAIKVASSLEIYMSKHGLELLNQIDQAVILLQGTIDECRINGQKNTVVGLENDIQKLVSLLTTDAVNHHLPVLSIVGMMGVGKTILAKEIFYHRTIVNHFPRRAWVKISEGAVGTARVLLINRDDERNIRTANFGRVRELLEDMPCLVVLDNVSTTQDWEQLRAELNGMRNESRIVLTRRFTDEAFGNDQIITPYHIRLRTDEETWKLFQMMMTLELELNPAVEELARKAVRRCGGLPVAILSLGYLLITNYVTEMQLSRELNRIHQGQKAHTLTPWSNTVEMNYANLNDTSKVYLTNCRAFPADFKIPARRLVSLSVSRRRQGDEFDARNNRELEDAEDLEALLHCNLIQAVELKPDGKIKTYRLPSVLRKLLRDRNINQNAGDNVDIRLQNAYLFEDHYNEGDPYLASISREGSIVCVLYFDSRNGCNTGRAIGSLLSNYIKRGYFSRLEVLDLENVFRPHLPEILTQLTELKYLGLRSTELEEIPPFIDRLFNLETLDVYDTNVRSVPSSIWRMRNLRNLYLSRKYRTKFEGQPNGNFLENLQTFLHVLIDGSSCLLNELHRLRNLRKLNLAVQFKNVRQQRALSELIVQLDQLSSLKIRSVDEMGNPQDLTLNNMSQMRNLSSLYVFGKLLREECLQLLPQSLTHLTLSASELSEDPMPVLQMLLGLESLCFYSNSYTGNGMHCTPGSFRELRVLRFWFLDRLEGWNVEEGAMPNLKELEIRSCKKLEFPNGLKHLQTLHTIKLTGMPAEFTTAIERIKQTYWDDIEVVYD